MRKDSLLPGEKVLIVARKEAGRAIFFTIITLGIYWFWWHAYSLTVTNRRIIFTKGVFSREEKAAMMEKLQDVTVRQTLWSRIFNYGDVLIETAGSEETEFVCRRLARPQRVRNAILQAQVAQR